MNRRVLTALRRALVAAILLASAPGLAQTVPQYTTNGRPSAVGDPISLSQTERFFGAKADYLVLNVMAHCAPAALDGHTDNTACIQAAVADICTRAHGVAGSVTNGGGRLVFPPNSYVIDVSIGVTVPCEGVTLDGGGWGDPNTSLNGQPLATTGAVLLLTGSGDKPAFAFTGQNKGNAARYSYGGRVTGFFFVGTPSGTGPAAAFGACFSCELDHVFTLGLTRAVTNDAGFGVSVHDARFSQMQPGGEAIKWSGSDAGCAPTNIADCPGRGDVMYLDRIIVDAAIVAGQPNSACLRFSNFVATVMIDHVVCNQVILGIDADCPDSAALGECPQFFAIHDFESEPSSQGSAAGTAAGIVLSDVVHFECTACQVYGYGMGNAVRAQSTRFAGAGDIKFRGGKLSSSLYQCVLASVAALTIDGVQIDGCGQSSPGTYWGVEVRPNTPGGVPSGSAYGGSATIVNNHFCTALGGVPTLMGAVLLNPGLDGNVVRGNNFVGCKLGVADLSGGAHEAVGDNVGP